jgi:hypothetical protein
MLVARRPGGVVSGVVVVGCGFLPGLGGAGLGPASAEVVSETAAIKDPASTTDARRRRADFFKGFPTFDVDSRAA